MRFACSELVGCPLLKVGMEAGVLSAGLPIVTPMEGWKDWLVIEGNKVRIWRLVRTVAGKRACVQLARTLVLVRVTFS